MGNKKLMNEQKIQIENVEETFKKLSLQAKTVMYIAKEN